MRVLLCLLLLAAPAWAQPGAVTNIHVSAGLVESGASNWTCEDTHVASTHSQADVQTAVNAADDGDCVSVPVGDGDVTWASSVNITSKCIQLVGPGSGSLIVRDEAVHITTATAAVQGTGCARVTGFHFIMDTADSTQIAIIASRGFRFDHNIIEIDQWQICWNTIGNQGSRTTYGNEGLIDNNTITNCRFVSYGEEGDGFGGADRWLETATIGTYHTTYLEDNVYSISSSGCIQEAGFPSCSSNCGVLCNFTDANYGGSYVARFNDVADSYFEGHPTSGGSFASRFWEVYGNEMSIPTARRYDGFCHWGIFYGGQGMVWGNTATEDCDADDSDPNRFDLGTHDGDDRGAMGACDGDNYVDSNELGTGWLCRNQPGAGATVSYWKFADGAPAAAQAKAPLYMWNNTAPLGNWKWNEGDANIGSDRDYYSTASGVQTTSSSPFNGTTGTGWGTLARRPTTCTTGVGYFATDDGSWNQSSSNPRGTQMNGSDGVLYRCSATNTWSVYYTPYTYPHPLQN